MFEIGDRIKYVNDGLGTITTKHRGIYSVTWDNGDTSTLEDRELLKYEGKRKKTEEKKKNKEPVSR